MQLFAQLEDTLTTFRICQWDMGGLEHSLLNGLAAFCPLLICMFGKAVGLTYSAKGLYVLASSIKQLN